MGEVVRLLADANAFLTKKIEVRGLGRTDRELLSETGRCSTRHIQAPFHETIWETQEHRILVIFASAGDQSTS